MLPHNTPEFDRRATDAAACGTGVAPPRRQQARAAKDDASIDEDSEERDVEADEERVEESDTLLTMSAHYPIRILRRSGQRYQVEWNDPPGERTWESVSKWDTMMEYRDLVLAFRAEEKAQSIA